MADQSFQLFDRAAIPKGVKLDAAGNLIAIDAAVARTGIYDYAGYELGRPDLRRVRVYRPPEEVFSRDAMRSIAGIPVTDNHPKELVDTGNWKEYAKGETSDDDIVRDGEVIRVPFIVRDASAIKSISDGKHELSPGYTAVIDWTAGQTDAGEEYDAVARNIRYNHLAIVDRARGGSSLRIGDDEPGETKVADALKMILVDGFSVETTVAGEQAIIKLSDERTELRGKLTAAETALTDANKAKATLEGEKAALEAQLKDARDPAALQAAALVRSALCDKAKLIVPKIVTDGKADAEIRKEVVNAVLGDAAKDMTDDQIAGAFATLAATVKDAKPGGRDQIANTLRETHIGDGDGSLDDLNKAHETARQKMLDRFATASRPAAAKE